MNTYDPSEGGGVIRRTARLLEQYPNYVTVGGAAKILNCSRTSIYHSTLVPRVEEGIRLYLKSEVITYGRTLALRHPTKLQFKGIEVERIMKICEMYYKTQRDVAESHLLSLAKRVAKL